jgi:tetratricopeptide (TPR) repeat protein
MAPDGGSIMRAKKYLIAAALAVLWPLTAAAGDASVKSLSDQVQKAIQAGDWQGAATALKELIPKDGRWSNYQALGDVQYNLGQYDDAVTSFDSAISGALADKQTSHDTIATALSQMFMAKGHALAQLGKDDDAITSFTEAAEEMSNPGQAYFNICALEYNDSLTTLDPVKACDKAIAADPTLADAYFIKGSILVSKATIDANGKQTFPPGTGEALQKYLDLAPNGAHAQDARDMLGAVQK